MLTGVLVSLHGFTALGARPGPRHQNLTPPPPFSP
jgi:hypothetical protein